MHAYHRLGRYIIEEEIASGGMATVYRGKLLGIEGFANEVAIKRILPYWSHKQEFIDMLIDEAKVLVHLHHNNIVQVIELGKENENYFLVMEYIDGFDLRRILTRLKEKNVELDLSLVTYIIKQICFGLEFAHTRKNREGKLLNIIHRDISPQNILVSHEGDVKITDFGIAKVIGKSKDTNTGVLKGKFSYMSPEQAKGIKLDQRSDIFAVGLVMYELLFNKKCFSGENDLEIIEKVKHGAIDFPDSSLPPVQTILRKCLAKDVDNRYNSVSELRYDLEQLETKLPTIASSHELKNIFKQIFNDSPQRTFEASTHTKHTTSSIIAGPKAKTKILERELTATVIDNDTFIAEETIVEEDNSESSPANLNTGVILTKRPRKRSKAYRAVLLLLLVFIVGYSVTGLKTQEDKNELRNTAFTQSESDDGRGPNYQANLTRMLPTPPQTPNTNTLVKIDPKIANNDIDLEDTKSGTIKISSRPWGKVVYKDSGLNNTPHIFNLPAGMHKLKMVFPQLNKSKSFHVKVLESKFRECTLTVDDMICK
jgi:serine/threonine protein kinase